MKTTSIKISTILFQSLESMKQISSLAKGVKLLAAVSYLRTSQKFNNFINYTTFPLEYCFRKIKWEPEEYILTFTKMIISTNLDINYNTWPGPPKLLFRCLWWYPYEGVYSRKHSSVGNEYSQHYTFYLVCWWKHREETNSSQN